MGRRQVLSHFGRVEWSVVRWVGRGHTRVASGSHPPTPTPMAIVFTLLTLQEGETTSLIIKENLQG